MTGASTTGRWRPGSPPATPPRWCWRYRTAVPGSRPRSRRKARARWRSPRAAIWRRRSGAATAGRGRTGWCCSHWPRRASAGSATTGTAARRSPAPCAPARADVERGYLQPSALQPRALQLPVLQLPVLQLSVLQLPALQPQLFSPSPQPSAEGRGGHDRAALADVEDAGEAGGLETGAGVVGEHGVLDGQGPGPVVADEEDGAAPFPGLVVGDDGAGDRHGVLVAVGVDGAAAAAAGGAGPGGVGAGADRLVAGHDAVEHHPGHADAAQRAAVGAGAAAEGIAGDVHRAVLPLGQRPDRGAAEVGAGREAAVADEPRVDDLELAAEIEDGAPAAGAAEVVIGLLGGGVAVLEGHV